MIIIAFLLLCGLIGWGIGLIGYRGRGLAGFVLGFTLGLLGLVIVACLGPSRKVREAQARIHDEDLKASILADLRSGEASP